MSQPSLCTKCLYCGGKSLLGTSESRNSLDEPMELEYLYLCGSCGEIMHVEKYQTRAGETRMVVAK